MQDYQGLEDIVKGEIRFNEPMKNHTSFQIGGPAEVMVFPKDKEDLINFIQFISNKKIPFLVIGNGTNLLVKDKGIKGIVINLKKGFNHFGYKQGCDWSTTNERYVFAEAGCLLPSVLNFVTEECLGGLEFMAGLPGTIGGAIVMNAGAFGKSIGEVIDEVEFINSAGKIVSLKKKDLKFQYRSSSFPLGDLILKVILKLQKVDGNLIKKKITKFLEERKLKQPLSLPNAGSIFKNPPHSAAGRLIEMTGLKGLRIGDAEISTKHANFIVNKGRATANDVILLMEKIVQRVKEETGINLEPEVLIVGE